MLARSDLSRRRPRTERGPAAPPPRRPDPPKLRSAAPAATTATTRITISTADIRTSAHMLRVGLAAYGACLGLGVRRLYAPPPAVTSGIRSPEASRDDFSAKGSAW